MKKFYQPRQLTDVLSSLRQTQTCLRWEEIDGPWTISILLDETAMVLGTRCGVDGSPAVLTVVAEAVDVATEVGSIATATVHTLALITDLVIQHIGLHLNLHTAK